mmetsp:Transcript_15011/g.45828  ORF Transcript_15011/g.45828 Transcript_15011/m.45828 type:complete len:637 (+) Transcript_15011:381-2291(+)
MLKDPDFAFVVKSSWRTHVFDEAHAMDLETILPVFSDRISIKAQQWAVPISDSECMVCAKVRISVSRLPGISGTVERGIEKGMRDAYAQLPARAFEYAQRNPQSIILPSLTGSVQEEPAPQSEHLGPSNEQAKAVFVDAQMPSKENVPVDGITPHSADIDSSLASASSDATPAAEATPALGSPNVVEGLLSSQGGEPLFAEEEMLEVAMSPGSSPPMAVYMPTSPICPSSANGADHESPETGAAASMRTVAAAEQLLIERDTEAEGLPPSERIALLRRRTAALRDAVRAAEAAADAQETALAQEAERARRELQAHLHAEEERSMLLRQRVDALEKELEAERRLVSTLMAQLKLASEPSDQSSEEVNHAFEATNSAIADAKAATQATAVAAAACEAHDASSPASSAAVAARTAAAILDVTTSCTPGALGDAEHEQSALTAPLPSSGPLQAPDAATLRRGGGLTSPADLLFLTPPDSVTTPTARELAGDAGEQMLNAIAASHLPEVLTTIEGGTFAGEVALRSVQLGTQELVCSNMRLLHLLWSSRGDEITKSWNVAWGRIKGVELQRDKSRVMLLLFSSRELQSAEGEPDEPIAHPASRQIECHNSAAARLVYDAVQAGRAMYSERNAMMQLAASHI